MSAALEREIKLAAPEELALPRMDDAVPGLVDGDPVRVELDAVYYDTFDLALVRAGVTLRHRDGELGPPWTVKLPEPEDGLPLTRLEVRFDGAPDSIPTDARDLVRAYVRLRRLRPVARLHTQRTVVPLIDGDGHRTADLVDDLVAGYRGEQLTTVFREIELELAGTRHQRRLQRAAVKRLEAAGCRAETARPKVVRVLGERAVRPADVTIPSLDADPTVLDTIRCALAVSVDRLIRHDPGVRLGDDPEAVHQLRVAARTLRSNLKTFGPVLDTKWAKALRTELGWLGSAAGGLRDLDVLEQRLRRSVLDLGSDDDAGVAALFGWLSRQKEQARTTTLAALRCRRYDVLLEDLVEAVRSPSLSAEAETDAPARAFLRHASATAVKRLDRVVAGVSNPPSDADLHRVRIQAKRTRYAIEAARPVIGSPAAEHAAAIAALQDVLGDFHDSTVMVEWLREAASGRPDCGLAAGQLLAAQRVEQRRLRHRVHDVWRIAAAPGLRHWL
jgi:CHAD domain-containing protein